MKFIACLVITCAATMALGQQPGSSAMQSNQANAKSAEPNPLDQLAFMQGDWTGKQNFETQGGAAMVGEATDRVDVCVAGKYLCEMLSTTLPGRKATDTRHFISYEKATGKYTAWWFNDTSTHPTALTGEVSGNKLVLMSNAAGAGPVLRATYEGASPQTLTFLLEMKTGDAWTKLFLTTYTRSVAATTPEHMPR